MAGHRETSAANTDADGELPACFSAKVSSSSANEADVCCHSPDRAEEQYHESMTSGWTERAAPPPTLSSDIPHRPEDGVQTTANISPVEVEVFW